jgi:hypothetical protein
VFRFSDVWRSRRHFYWDTGTLAGHINRLELPVLHVNGEVSWIVRHDLSSGASGERAKSCVDVSIAQR